MAKVKFTSDFELHVSAKMVFPFISTPTGLEEWFANKVSITPEGNWLFSIDGDQVFAKVAFLKNNVSIKIEFLDDQENQEDDPSYLEMVLETNELTGALYFVVTDYSDFIENEDEHYELWESLVDALHGAIGIS